MKASTGASTKTDIYLDYAWTDKELYPLETKREYFPDAEALYRRRAELEDMYALIIGVHVPQSPAVADIPFII